MQLHRSISFPQIRGLLVIAFSFIPFTSLRLGFIGLGELLIMLSAGLSLVLSRALYSFNRSMFLFFGFWFAYFLLMLAGLFYNGFFLGFQSGRQFTGAFDFLAYLFILLTILLLSESKLYIKSNPADFFEKVFFVWGLIFAFLYFLSLFMDGFLGLPLRYYHFFSPLVDNVHQIASITCVMPFIMFFLALRQSRLSIRIIYVFLGVLFIRMALESGSTKAFMGVVSGGVSSLFFLFFYRASGRGRASFNFLSIFFASLFGLLFFSFYYDQISRLAVSFFTENDGEHARQNLYLNGLEHGLNSFFFGYGPGSHTPYGFGYSDAHNTFLTIFLQAGFFGVVFFLVFLTRFFLAIRGSFFLVGAFFAVFMYILGGDVLRRLPIWIILVGIYYLSADENNVQGDSP